MVCLQLCGAAASAAFHIAGVAKNREEASCLVCQDDDVSLGSAESYSRSGP